MRKKLKMIIKLLQNKNNEKETTLLRKSQQCGNKAGENNTKFRR